MLTVSTDVWSSRVRPPEAAGYVGIEIAATSEAALTSHPSKCYYVFLDVMHPCMRMHDIVVGPCTVPDQLELSLLSLKVLD